MAEEKIKLQKNIISNKLSNKIYSKSFEDLTKSSNPINEEKALDLYQNLFYNIPKEGKNSHKSIITESRDYLYPEVRKNSEVKIEQLIEDISNLNKELQLLKTAPPANTEYPNGSFITAGNSSGQFQGMTTVYIMQDGMKRAFGSEGFYKIARKAFKIPGELYSELYFLSISELNEIPDGLKIERQSQFSAKNIEADYGIIYQKFPYHNIKLHCEGREADDSMDLVAGNFWLDDDPDDACTVIYVKNELDGDPEKYSIETKTIGVGQSISIKFARDQYGMKGIPQEAEAQYDSYYDYNIDIQKTGTRTWGKDKKYKGILLAEGRIFNKTTNEHFNTKTNQNLLTEIEFDEIFGNVRKIYSHGCRQLDGTYEDCFGDLNQNNILGEKFNNPDFAYYQKNITIKNSDINNSFNTTLLSGYTSVPTNSQYAYSTSIPWSYNHKSLLLNKTFPIYGQPILRLTGKYVVYLKSGGIDKNESARYHYFYILNPSSSGKNILTLADSDIPDLLFNKNSSVYKEQKALHTSHNALRNTLDLTGQSYINTWRLGLMGQGQSPRFNWEAVSKSKIEYIGLTHEPIKNKKVNLTGYSGGNYFNPYEEGSNYGISGEVRTTLEENNDNINDTSSDFCPFTKSQLEQFELMSIPAGSNTNFPLGCTYTNCLDC
jgi:hypothetical protein